MTDDAVLDPFAMGLFGGLPKTATSASETSTGGTTVRENRSERETSLSGPAINSSSGQVKGTRRSRGAILSIAGTGKKGSSATSSGTKGRTSRRSLSDRLTPSLISLGLVCGITPSSTRKQSGQPILVLAFDMPAGDAAGKPRLVSSSSSAKP